MTPCVGPLPMDEKLVSSQPVFLSERIPKFSPGLLYRRRFLSPSSRPRHLPRPAFRLGLSALRGVPLRPDLTKERLLGIIGSNQTAMKGKNASVPLREPVVGANRCGGGADTGPGVARLRSICSRVGRLAPLPALALLEAVSARRQRRTEPGWYRVEFYAPDRTRSGAFSHP